MNEEAQDQVETEGQQEQVETTADDQGGTQSGEEQASAKMFRLDGKDMTAEEYYEASNKKIGDLNKGFTQTRQEIAELKRELSERAERSKVAEDALKGVPEDVKQAILGITVPEVKRILGEQQKQIEARERVEKYYRECDDLAKEWDGKDGKPKFRESDRSELMEFMKTSGIYNTKAAFREMRWNEIQDYFAKSAISKKSGTAPTERTSGTPGGSTLNKKPAAPKSLSEASDRAFSRFTQ